MLELKEVGRKEGIAIGAEQGEQRKAASIITNMLRKGKDPEEIAESLQALEKELDALYTEILKNPNMVAFQEAKDKMDSMTKQIDAIITLCLQGEDPDTCHPDLSQCSGDCSACGGCH